MKDKIIEFDLDQKIQLGFYLEDPRKKGGCKIRISLKEIIPKILDSLAAEIKEMKLTGANSITLNEEKYFTFFIERLKQKYKKGE